MRFGTRLFCLIALLASGFAGVVSAQDPGPISPLAEVGQLARSGAPQLALKRLDVLQPSFDEDPVQWMIAERERIYLLRSQGDAETVIARMAALPVGVSNPFRYWAYTELAAAQLDRGNGREARRVLRELLWTAASAVEVEVQARWRRMVIRTYLLDGLLEDARAALVRYQQDFGDAGRDWNRLRAEVLLRTERFNEVLAVLDDQDDAISMVLLLTAQLRGEAVPATDIYAAARGLAEQAETDPNARGLAWTLAVEASRGGDPAVYIDALEHALALPLDSHLDGHLYQLDADMLWDAYFEYGQVIGNREQRLLGQDEDWYFPATEAIETDPARARLFFAILTRFGSSAHRQELAHEYLVSLFEALPHGSGLIRRLYLDSRRFADRDRLPGIIRYRLIDEALETGDLELASRLMRGVDAVPQGTDAVEWGLRRARVAIHAARPDEGAAVLAELLEGAELSEDQLDRWMQVVFDLQTVKAHDQALALFDRLMVGELAPQRRRELLFWQADSWLASGDPAQAAYLYLKSATLLDPAAMDPWAQTARYHAAQALAEAGLLADARRVYGALLNSTRDAGRRAVLRNEIQRLQLQGSR